MRRDMRVDPGEGNADVSGRPEVRGSTQAQSWEAPDETQFHWGEAVGSLTFISISVK